MSETVTYSVPAIHCAHCAMSIREEISEVQGVDVGRGRSRHEGRHRQRAGAWTTPRCARPSWKRGTRRRDAPSRSRERHACRLALEGMTCAACANRIERKLNKLDGVDASVNYATEQAAVRFDPGASPSPISSARSRRPGTTPRSRPRREQPSSARTPPPPAPRRGRAHGAARVLAMVPPLQFAGWEWVALALATPVVFWAGSLPSRRLR